ncbi:UvrB/UvrC motif-containing protein, partial [Candidatus Ozemobacteraceae bacterium]|nr:UvrB/UvrC motif-containing protein [Candidatus Ozemobacteraceae bacterium]
TCIDETARRREIQDRYNREHGIEPASIVKKLPKIFLPGQEGGEQGAGGKIDQDRLAELVRELQAEMDKAARELQFERAAMIRDEIIALQDEHLEADVLMGLGKALRSGRDRSMAKKRNSRRSRSPQKPG